MAIVKIRWILFPYILQSMWHILPSLRSDIMAKKGMRRPSPETPHGDEANGQKQDFPKNDAPPVPEVRGKKKKKS